MVMSSTVTALAVWAALGGAALFYGKTAGLALVTAVFVFTCIKRRMAVRPRDKNAALRNTAVALILGALVGGWGLYRSAESERPLVSLAPASQIRSISGEVASNAVITGSGRYYRIFLETEEVTTGGYGLGDGKTARYSAKGRVLVFIPAAFVEAYFPDKLYSRAGGSNGGGSAAGGKGMPLFVPGERLTLAVQPSKKTAQEGASEGVSVFTAEKVLAWKEPSKGASIRGILRLQYRRLIYGWKRAGGLLLALTAASKDYLDTKTAEAFTAAGLAHVLALSGMHLSIIGGGAAFFGRKLAGKRAVVLSTFAGTAFFVWFAGGSPSLIRALIFLLISAAGRMLYLSVTPINALSATFLVQLLLFPQDASSLSFILSYAALAGIFLAGKPLEQLLAGKLPKSIMSSFPASMGAQLATAPIMAYSFGCLMPGGIIASMAVSPLVSLFLMMGICAVFLALLFPPLGEVLGMGMNLIYLPIEEMVYLFARIPVLKIGDTKGTILIVAAVILIYGGLLLLRAAKRKKVYVRFARL